MRRRLRRDVVRAAGLGRGERVLAAAWFEGGWTLATTRALHVVTTLGVESRPDAARNVSWVDIRSATTVPERSALDVTLVDGARWVVPVGKRPGRLPQAIRERVQNSVVVGRFVEVRRNKGVHLSVRRDARGHLLLQQSVDDEVGGLASLTPEQSREVDRVRAELRSEFSLPIE